MVAVLAMAPAVTAAGCGLIGGDSDEAAPEPEISIRKDIEYGTAAIGAPRAADAPLLLDLYLPPNDTDGDGVSDDGTPLATWPIVIVLHGDGPEQSRSDESIVRIAEGLAQRGMAAASIDYRAPDQAPVPSERVQPLLDGLPRGDESAGLAAAVDDTLTAADYLNDHATELNLDISRLGVIGSSDGAVTADHVAYVLDDYGIPGPRVTLAGSLWGGILAAPPENFVDTAVPAASTNAAAGPSSTIAGPSSTTPVGSGDHSDSAGTTTTVANIGAVDPDTGAVVAAVQLEPGEAVLFAVHGDADEEVPVELDDQLVDRATAVGVQAEYHRIPGGGHGYDASEFFEAEVISGRTSFQRLMSFAKDVLIGP
jgi:acetyl esterase/lipase